MAKLRVAVADALSVTFAVKLKAPAVESVPLTMPLLASARPAGAVPDQR